MKDRGLILGLLPVLFMLGSASIVLQPSIAHASVAIQIQEDGIYQLTYIDLQTAGVPVDSLDPRTFHLHNHGSEVAIYAEGESDGSFDSGDYITLLRPKKDLGVRSQILIIAGQPYVVRKVRP